MMLKVVAWIGTPTGSHNLSPHHTRINFAHSLYTHTMLHTVFMIYIYICLLW